MQPLRVLDLFSGIGGFSLGLERAGMKTVAFCEIDPYARAVLRKHWPDVPCYDDVRTLTADRLARDGIAVDVICGGFPCQDISVAGKGAGLAGERSGLWSEIARLVGELRPRFAIVENVAALLGRGLGDVLGDLAALGYDAEWHCIPASAVGLPHIRDRVWVVAYPRKERGKGVEFQALQELYGIPWRENERRATRWRERPDLHGPRLCVRRNGLSEELGAYGNAVVPQIPEIIGKAIIEAEANYGDRHSTITPPPLP
jgi:DNA (cytosine-5)-methyltransferase 1